MSQPGAPQAKTQQSPRPQKFDIQEFVDLKSVSNYGWRVDIERLRSKYFVDMMKAKEDGSQPPMPQASTDDDHGPMPSKAGGSIMDHIQMIKNESSKEFREAMNANGRRSTVNNTAGAKPPLGKEEGGAKTAKGKPNKYEIAMMKDNYTTAHGNHQKSHSLSSTGSHNRQQDPLMVERMRNARRVMQLGKIQPAPGQYQPKYSYVTKQSYTNPVFHKADRFMSKEVFPNTWLNKPELNIYAKTSISKLRRSSNLSPTTPFLAGAIEWAQNPEVRRKGASSVVVNEDIKENRISPRPLELGPEASQYEDVKVVIQEPNQSGCFRFRRTLSRGFNSSTAQSMVTTPGGNASNIRFEKQIPRKELRELSHSPDPLDCRFENFQTFSPNKQNQFKFEWQTIRPPFIKSDYVSVGGFTYDFAKAQEKFHFSEATLRKAQPFKQERPDYKKKKEQEDMIAVMVKRRKESKRRARLDARKGVGYEDKWAIEGTPKGHPGSSRY